MTAEVHNAKDAHRRSGEKFLLTGKAGGGKTAQFLTLPGKKFLYIFDPSALNTIVGYDVDYIELLPEASRFAPKTLKGEDRGKIKSRKPTIAAEFDTHVEESLDGDFFDKYDVVGIDGLTLMGDAIMEEVLYLNGRAGQFPQQDDYGPQMIAINNITKALAGRIPTFFMTAHEELVKDEISGKIQNEILTTGKLRIRLPALFSEIYHCECRSTEKSEKFVIQTRPNRENPLIRCTLKGLEMFEDVTIDWSKPIEAQGLGRIVQQTKRRQ